MDQPPPSVYQSSSAKDKPREWSIKQIRDLCQAKLGKRPCWYQIQIALKLRAGHDVVGCARTGVGKTLSFWIALLMALEEGRNGMIFVVTALNLLGKQNSSELGKVGLKAVALNKDTAKPGEIESGAYNVVIVSPEIMMSHPEMQAMWTRPAIARLTQYIVFDEGHCIAQWASFRSEYAALGALRHQAEHNTPFYVASATLPPEVLREVKKTLSLRDNTAYIMRSNNRPEIALTVRPMQYSARTYNDLNFIIPASFAPRANGEIPPFVIFFNNTKETEAAVRHLRRRLPKPLRHKIKWFHSTLSAKERDLALDQLREGKIWGICCTDAFGMGMDLSGIHIVVQWKPPSDLCTLWQRFGRAARGPNETATAILIVPKSDTLEERTRKAEQAEKRAASKAAKASSAATGVKRKKKSTIKQPAPSNKRPALATTSTNVSTRQDDVHSDGTASSDNENPSPPPVVLDRIERRQHYANEIHENSKSPDERASKRASRRAAAVTPGSAVDDFINPKARGFSCRRQVADLYFSNDLYHDDDHLRCDPDSPSGCSRCAPRPTHVCCDICAPDAFAGFFVSLQKPQAKPGKSKIKAMDSARAASDDIQALHAELLQWREDACISARGANSARLYGGRSLMSNRIVERLIECAEARKIKDSTDIARETGWISQRAVEYGSSIITILHRHCPLEPQPDNSTSVKKKSANANGKKPITCGRCKMQGHSVKQGI